MSPIRRRTGCPAVTEDLVQALHHVATFGDSDQIPARAAAELRARGLIAGPPVAPFVTASACVLLARWTARRGTAGKREA